jgi:hypothetical protein
MGAIVVPVDDGGHPAYHLATFPRQEELRFRVGVKRMLFAVQQLFDRDAQLWHPVRIVAVDRERQFHELMQCLFVVHCRNFNTYQS